MTAMVNVYYFNNRGFCKKYIVTAWYFQLHELSTRRLTFNYGIIIIRIK